MSTSIEAVWPTYFWIRSRFACVSQLCESLALTFLTVQRPYDCGRVRTLLKGVQLPAWLTCILLSIIWPGTPLITFPKYHHKMCSRVAASMVNATGFGDEMIVASMEEYEDRAVALANSLSYVPETEPDGTTILRGQGELIKLRRNLFLNRDKMPLFDTVRWTRNMEKGYREAWRRWVEGTQFELSDEWEACQGPEKESGCIWVPDDDPVEVVRYD